MLKATYFDSRVINRPSKELIQRITYVTAHFGIQKMHYDIPWISSLDGLLMTH